MPALTASIAHHLDPSRSGFTAVDPVETAREIIYMYRSVSFNENDVVNLIV